jgi:prophage regulatory protein
MNNYLTNKEVAAMCGVSTVTIWRWAKAGKFPQPVKLGENTTRFSATAVSDWLASRVPA